MNWSGEAKQHRDLNIIDALENNYIECIKFINQNFLKTQVNAGVKRIELECLKRRERVLNRVDKLMKTENETLKNKSNGANW